MPSAEKRVIFIFGAGAAMDWGGPKTICGGEDYRVIPDHQTGEIKNRPCCLTHLITKTGFKNAKGERITKVIYDLLTSANKACNFEGLINILEDLYAYYGVKFNDGQKKDDAALSSIFDFDVAIDTLSHFEIRNRNEVTNSYTLHIPGHELYDQDNLPANISPHQKYFELFINDILGGIIGHISKYAYYSPGHDVIFCEANKNINDDFYKWMDVFTNGACIARMYTLNYDCIFKILLELKGINIFDGFGVESGTLDFSQPFPPSLKRIVNDFDTHSFYNLHGSAYWDVEPGSFDAFAGYQYNIQPIGPIPRSSVSAEMEKGKRILLTSIITGYQKVQRTAISPFRQMFSAFDRDCYNADEIYIIGYSFGDEHVNDIIRNSKRNNQPAKITIVDPAFNELQFLINFMSHWGITGPGIYRNAGDEIVSDLLNIRISKKTFAGFLSGEI